MKEGRENRRSRSGPLKAAVGLSIAAILAGIGCTRLFVPRALPLPSAVPGERRELWGRAGRLSYYVAGPVVEASDQPPLLLVHSLNAAGSAYEMRPLFSCVPAV